MNRRDFNTSLAALFSAPALPLPAAAVGTAAPNLPPATYLWADMIARARGHVDAGFLARKLGLSGSAAQSVINQLIADGALQVPGVSGVAKAVQPIRFEHAKPAATDKIMQHVHDEFTQIVEDALEDDASDDNA